MKRGFTLLELLIVTAIVAVASAVVLGGFAAGIRVWERAREFSGPGMKARLAMAMVRQDLSTMISCRAVVFKGGSSWVEFPAVVSGGASNLWPGKTRYEFDQGVITRLSRGLDVSGSLPETREVMMSGADRVLFLYGDAGGDGHDSISWAHEWESRTNLPVAIKMTVSYPEGKEHHELQQTLILPRGYPVKDERGRK
jgi:prepilin-type N-terminal cleavage/methylation domain-containing protein